jgi:hypothetical protein
MKSGASDFCCEYTLDTYFNQDPVPGVRSLVVGADCGGSRRDPSAVDRSGNTTGAERRTAKGTAHPADRRLALSTSTEHSRIGAPGRRPHRGAGVGHPVMR